MRPAPCLSCKLRSATGSSNRSRHDAPTAQNARSSATAWATWGSTYWTNISTFLLIFYTDVFGISAAAAASMLFIVKIFNAFTDPMIGAYADRMQTRWGKFRPFLLFVPVPMAIPRRAHVFDARPRADGQVHLGHGDLSAPDDGLHRRQPALQRTVRRDHRRCA